MKKYLTISAGIALFILILTFIITKNNYFTPDTQDDNQTSSGTLTKLQEFPELGISLEVPESLEVVKSPDYNLDDPDKLDNYLFYIQDYTDDGGIDFQIYGLNQYNLPTTTWEQLAEVKNDNESYKYVKEITLGGLRGFETQLTGVRSNYVYLLLLDGRVLRIAVSPPTDAYKNRADAILNTLKVL